MFISIQSNAPFAATHKTAVTNFPQTKINCRQTFNSSA